jgi:pyruvate formate lyase activating enzyme
VTLSGGEPLGHPDFCLAVAEKSRHHGVHVTLDTCGLVSPVGIKKVMNTIDLFLFDLKFIDENLHQTYTHASNRQILKNFAILIDAGKAIEVRVPLIPGITDTRDNLAQIEAFVRSYSSDIKIFHVPFNRLYVDKYKMMGKKPPVLISKNFANIVTTT